jgi:hypothetical protein
MRVLHFILICREPVVIICANVTPQKIVTQCAAMPRPGRHLKIGVRKVLGRTGTRRHGSGDDQFCFS